MDSLVESLEKLSCNAGIPYFSAVDIMGLIIFRCEVCPLPGRLFSGISGFY